MNPGGARKYTVFYIRNTFISNTRLKLAKNQANTKRQPEAELLLLENYLYSSLTLSSKNNRTYSKNKQNNKCACIHEIIRLDIMKMKKKMKNRSHRYDIKYLDLDMDRNIVNIKRLSVMILICIKQH